MPRAWKAAFWSATLAAHAAQAEVVDPEFTQNVVVAPATQAGTSGIAWAPDGSPRLFYTRQTGLVRVVENGVLLAKPFAVIKPVVTDVETGVIGLAFDPNYISNHYLYVFVTVSVTEQQIIRYTDVANVGTDKTTIVAGLPTRGVNHDGGAIGFGPDGKLYWAIGDLGNQTGADDDLTSVAAKVSRVNLDGSAPADNPFFDADGPNDDRIWARGFRNPFSFTWQPSTGQLWVNVTGAIYEQIFAPKPADHAGWGSYQNDQPPGFITPKIVYRSARSDRFDIAPTGATRASGTATFTTTQAHGLRLGEKVTLSGVGDASFDGDFFVTAVDSPTMFSFAQAGPDASSGGGQVATLLIGGALTGGTFWDSAAVPEAYRGNFFFGDYNSGNIARATFGADNVVASVDLWATTGGRMIDMAVGPDGDMYYATFNGGIYRLAHTATEQGIVLSQLNTRLLEGGKGGFSVRLATAPAAPAQVKVARVSGDKDVSITLGSSLSFDASNWSVPQFVELAAKDDADAAEDVATLAASSPGLTTEQIAVRVTDDDPIGLVVSPEQVTLNEGSQGDFAVSLTGAPARPLTLHVSVAKGDVTLAGTAELVFDEASWSEPQTVTLAAPDDTDALDGASTVHIDAEWLPALDVDVRVLDDDSTPAAGGGAGGTADEGAAGLGGQTLGGESSEPAVGGQAQEGGGGAPAAGDPNAQADSSRGCQCAAPHPAGSGAAYALAGLAAVFMVWRHARSSRRTRRRRPDSARSS